MTRSSRPTRWPRRRTALLRAVLVVALLTTAATAAEVFEELELPTIDARFVVRGAQPPPQDVVVVAIDEVTIERLGGTWPLPLTAYERVAAALAPLDPAVVVLDVPLGAPGEDPAGLVTALDALPAVTLATVRTRSDGTPVVLGGPAALALPGVRAGDARFDPDDDGVVRRVDHTLLAGDDDLDDDDGDGGDEGVVTADGVVPTVAIVAAEQATGRSYPTDVTGAEGAPIDHPGPAGTVARVSVLSLVDGFVDPSTVAGRIVVVGPTAPSAGDLHPTPLAEAASRAEIHAAAIATALDGFPLRTVPPWARLSLVLLACIAPVAAAGVRPGTGILLVGAVVTTWLVLAQVAFGFGWLVPVVPVVAGLVVAAVAVAVVDHAAEVRQRERVRAAFGRYVPPRVVREAVDADTGDDLLRAVDRDVTVLFTDLRGFTSLSEHRPPDEVIRLLNAYLGTMTDVVLDEGGSVLSYLGDGIMAVFGAPDPLDDHPDRALSAARRMIARLEAFNTEVAAQAVGTPLERPLRMGAGLHAGTVTAGNLGTVRRLEYTVIGDTVNTASRIESLTKQLGVDLLLSEEVRARLRSVPSTLVDHGAVPIRGRDEPIHLWSVPADVGAPVDG